MANLNSNFTTLVVSMLLAAGIAATTLLMPSAKVEDVGGGSGAASGASAPAQSQPAPSAGKGGVVATATPMPKPKVVWAASAPGRVEPREGEIRLTPPVAGKVLEIAVKTNDAVKAGDLIVRIEDEDYITKVAAAESEAQVRRRERDEEQVDKPSQQRRNAEDAVYDAERALYRARLAFDDAASSHRARKGSIEDVNAARFRIESMKERLEAERSSLKKIVSKESLPLPTRLDSSLAIARAELSLAESAVERTRVRAPVDGTVLNVIAKVGEVVAPSIAGDATLALFGDMSLMRVRAEVEERDATKVRIGQAVVVRCDAFPDQEFDGKVSSIARSLGPPRLASRGPRKPNDVEVLEVVIDLNGTPPLLSGMRTDVFFRHDSTAQSSMSGN